MNQRLGNCWTLEKFDSPYGRIQVSCISRLVWFSKNSEQGTRIHSTFLSHLQSNSAFSARNLRNASLFKENHNFCGDYFPHSQNLSGIHWIQAQKTQFPVSFLKFFTQYCFKVPKFSITLLFRSFSLGLSHLHENTLDPFSN